MIKLRFSLAVCCLVLFISILILFSFKIPFAKMPFSGNYEDYSKLWKEVDSLEDKGLTKSALEKVEDIYSIAEKSDNVPQVVKSLIYKVKYKQVLEEGGLEKALNEFETQINKSHFPTRNILQSAAAELYWGYYQQNRWRFLNRTQ